jgi:hypothetical protein
MRRGIEPHLPLLHRERPTNSFFTRADFTFDPQANVFICPGGKQLTTLAWYARTAPCPIGRAPRIAALAH